MWTSQTYIFQNQKFVKEYWISEYSLWAYSWPPQDWWGFSPTIIMLEALKENIESSKNSNFFIFVFSPFTEVDVSIFSWTWPLWISQIMDTIQYNIQIYIAYIKGLLKGSVMVKVIGELREITMNQMDCTSLGEPLFDQYFSHEEVCQSRAMRQLTVLSRGKYWNLGQVSEHSHVRLRSIRWWESEKRHNC